MGVWGKEANRLPSLRLFSRRFALILETWLTSIRPFFYLQ
jgi:hypothetical protein